MRKEILTCDRCKKDVDRLIIVGAGERSYCPNSFDSGGEYRVYQLAAEWCLDCCIEMGFANPVKSSPAVPITPPSTLEDIIREIIREEVNAAVHD